MNDSTPAHGLEAAVHAAIAEGHIEIEALREIVDSVRGGFGKARARVTPWTQDAEGPEAANALRQVADLLSDEGQAIGDLFDRQAVAIDHFNIALFGRTGAGKSTLLETFSFGSGARVSPGESDWTTDVEPVSWAGCRIIDTPGINGWGRTQSRADLEAKARHAVEVADVVVLCFDSQNQQATEFEKVGSWIQTYGKPAVAVLNVRNAAWRLPTRIPGRPARARMSRSVAQHAGHIQRNLVAIGLPSVPVVALHTQRALYARCSEPFEGPEDQRESVANLRREFGADRLLAWSNFPALEGLFTHLVRDSAVDLRLGMLREELAGALSQCDREIERYMADLATAIKPLDAQIESGMRLIGYAQVDDRSVFKDRRLKRDLLSELEARRGDAFDAPEIGEAGRHCAHLLSARLSPLRTAASARAEEAVLSAFDRQKQLSPDEFEAAALDRPAIQAAAEAVLEGVDAYVRAKLNLTANDASRDIQTLAFESRDVNGRSGTWARRGAFALNVSGILVSAVGVGLMFTPIGWIAAIGAGIVGAFLGWFGRKTREKAEEKRLHARRQAIADAHRSVQDAFSTLEEQILKEVDTLVRQEAGRALLAPLRLTVGLHLTADAGYQVRDLLAQALERIPTRLPVGPLLDRAIAETEDRTGVVGDSLWLGEAWIDDSEGLAADGHVPPTSRASTPPDEEVEALARWWETALSDTAPGAGSRWLVETAQDLAADEAAAPLLDRLTQIDRDGRPRIHLHGDYSSGKSSLIRRLLLEDGMPLPASLLVRADPTTDTVSEYPWRGILLVDTPGLQSSELSHRQAAETRLPEASVVLYLLHPQLVGGDLDFLETVLQGSAGKPAKRPRTLFLISQSDTLGVDPQDAPDAFRARRMRKVRELQAALQHQGARVSEDQIVCIAPDPYGTLGDQRTATRADLPDTAAWDGVGTILAAYKTVHPQLTEVGVDISVLEAGCTGLTDLAHRARDEASEATLQADAASRLTSAVESAASEGEVLRQDLNAHIERAMHDIASGLLADALSARSTEEIRAHGERLSEWWTDEAVSTMIDAWHARAKRDIDAWVRSSQSAINRQLGSARFKKAFPAVKSAFQGADLSGQTSIPGSGFVRRLGDTVGQATRDVVYPIAKFFGVKFRPWGAIKLARTVSRVGAVLAVAGVALETADFVSALRSQKRREEARREAATFVRTSADQLVESLTLGESGAAGPLAYIDAHLGFLENLQTTIQSEVDLLRAGADAHTLRGERYAARVAAASSALSSPHTS